MSLGYDYDRVLDQINSLWGAIKAAEEAQRIADTNAATALELLEEILDEEDDIEGHSAFYGYVRNASREADKATAATGKASSRVSRLKAAISEARKEFFWLKSFEG